MISPASIFRPSALDTRVSGLLASYPPGLFTEQLHFSIELTHRYTLELAAAVLERLGVAERLDAWSTAEDACRSAALQPDFCRALRWLMDAARELGDLEAKDGAGDARRYRRSKDRAVRNHAALRDSVIAVDGANAATLDLLDRAASLYPAIARGEATAEHALFDAESIALWLAYFRNDNPTYAVNNWVGALAAVDRIAHRPKLRILEIGAGAGSGAEMLLRLLTERGLASRLERYVVTEPSPFFLRRAQRHLGARYADLPLEFRPLDIDSGWEAQGAAHAGFDLVYGVNVMHVARDLAYSLKQARESLAADGWIVLGECLHTLEEKPVFPEFIFQLLDSFSAVRTDPELRPAAGFLAPRFWRRALSHAGFHVQQVEPDVERIAELCPNFLAGAVCGWKAGAGFAGSPLHTHWPDRA